MRNSREILLFYLHNNISSGYFIICVIIIIIIVDDILVQCMSTCIRHFEVIVIRKEVFGCLFYLYDNRW
jgi:hypothetical protein